MNPQRLWGSEDGPDADWIRPHVLWLPHNQPHVLAYLREVANVLAPYTEIVAPVAEPDLHWTIQAAYARGADGRYADRAVLDLAAQRLQDQVKDLAPFEVYLGPPAVSRSAVITRLVPVHEGTGPDPATVLNHRVRDSLEAAGLTMPARAAAHWGHVTAGYGLVNTDTPELVARSDDLASALTHNARRHIAVTVSSVWLVQERQHPEGRYTFERVKELPLAGSQRQGSGQAFPTSRA
ncbi:hypothetical protein ACFYN0_00880 [Streptomyces sp. NPDC006704]|uniref:hypothetical protein n=1 Tax=Streptomyces sp. NPDC006704 TaxID=3364760 RepID=UPI0036C87DCD